MSIAVGASKNLDVNMKLFSLSVLCLVLVSCGIPAQNQTPVTETVTVYPTTISLTPQPTETMQCIHFYSKSSWPVEEAISNWNKNGVNKLKTYQDGDKCDWHVVMQEVPPMPNAWAQTQYSPDTATVTILGSDAPPKLRKSILCHELGHVLGLGHEKGVTCMNIDHDDPLPSDQDLQTLRMGLWNWASASVSSQLH